MLSSAIIALIWHQTLRFIVFCIFFFLLFPIIIIIPLSFNAEPFFSFTEGMLSLDPAAYSTRWYQAFFADDNWQLAVKNSFYFASISSLLATCLGTLAALGLNSAAIPFKTSLNALIISPMIAPLVIIASGMYFFYSYIHIINSDLAIIIAHTTLGVPFVVITVSATLSHFDHNLPKASSILGANSSQTFFQVTLPIIKPGVISGALFAFVTSFDEIIIVLFMASAQQKTIPKQMFSGLREEINPTILAAAALLLLISVVLLVTIERLRRTGDKKTKK